MPRSLVDTNILLRLILHDELSQYKKAAQIVEKAPPGSLIVPIAVAAEIQYILGSKNYSRERSVNVLLILIERIQFKRNEILQNSLRHYAQTRLDFVDCYLLARVLHSGEGLKTLDDGLQKAYTRLNPS